MILRNFISLWAFTVYMENSLRFEISLRSNWPKWNLHRSDFHPARSYVNADNEVTLNRSEVLPRSETGLSSLRVSCKRALSKMDFSVECFTNDFKQHFTIKRVKIWLLGGLLNTCCQGQVFQVFSCNFLIL